MADIRAPDDTRELAKQDYLKGMKYKEICDKYDLSMNTLKSWVKRYGWAKDKKQRGAHKNKRGAPQGNKNAVGHGAPAKNKNAEKHGFFSKWLPEETAEIMESIQKANPLDILWDNIQLQYTAIIRAQKIMYVKDQEDVTTTKIEEKAGNVWGERWEVQQAWDKQASFLKAQSRAMGELRSMVKQYDELLKTELATEEQKLRIDKIRAEVSNLKGESGGDSQNSIDEFIKATTMEESEIRAMFEDDGREDIQEKES